VARPQHLVAADGEFFECERFRCTMLKIRCVQRQNRAIEEAIRDARCLYSRGPTAELVRFEACIRCGQGREIYQELTGMLPPTPPRRTRPGARHYRPVPAQERTRQPAVVLPGLAQAIKQKRGKLGLSQEGLARLIGQQQSTLSKIERGLAVGAETAEQIRSSLESL